MKHDSTSRFSNRVDHYVKARPSYPPAVLDLMRTRMGLLPGHRVADVGSGTGILTQQLLRNGNEVFAVEPNAPMRMAAEQMLGDQTGFHSLDGTAEATGLSDASVDFVTAAQAFHWFDGDRARAEFLRILKAEGWTVLIWNDRRHDRPPFSVEYHRVIRKYNSDFDRINHQHVSNEGSEALRRFFVNGFSGATFENVQELNWAGVQGRLFSSSYMPAPTDPSAEAMLRELETAFQRHARADIVRIEYDTRVFYGRL